MILCKPNKDNLAGFGLCHAAQFLKHKYDAYYSICLRPQAELWCRSVERCFISQKKFLATFTLLPALSKARRKGEGRNWVSSPQLIAVTPIRCVCVIQPPTPMCVVFTLFIVSSTHLPYASSFHSLCFDLASSVCPHNLFLHHRSVQCPTFALPFSLASADVGVRFRSYTVQACYNAFTR